MIFSIETLPEYKVAYIRRTGGYGEQNYAVMAELKSFAAEKGLLCREAVIFGIAMDNPASVPASQCRYDACIVVDDGFHSDGISFRNTHAGKYLIITTEHTPDGVSKAWGSVYTALSELNEKPDESNPIMERYTLTGVDNGICELCVPLE